MKVRTIALGLLVMTTGTAFSSPAPRHLDDLDVIWTSASRDSSGSMPLGNGEVVVNAWVEESSGDLMLLLGRSDALSEISRILKLGRVRVHLSPSPFGSSFQQRTRLRSGEIAFSGDGGTLRLFVDPSAAVIHLVGKFAHPTAVSATLERWRTAARELPAQEQASAWSAKGAPFPLVESADRLVPDDASVTWFHRNETSVVPKLWEEQSLTGLPGTFDPLIHRTFGGKIEGDGMLRSGEATLSGQPSRTLDLKIATSSAQTATVEEWLRMVHDESERSPSKAASGRNRRWWNRFWDRSWVFVEAPERGDVNLGYTLQRYVQACQGRGAFPIKFNGGTYTVEPSALGMPYNPDWRNWGDCHWWQNVRHMYHPVMPSGDFEMSDPLFRMYEAARPLAESRSKAYHGAEGAYFPETMTVFGTYGGEDYGWNRKGLRPDEVQSPWWRYAWNQGPELVCLMLDRWDYTRDSRFLRDRALPMAESVLRYFDTRFHRDGSRRLVLDPTQVVETYWEGIVDDMPSTAGLIAMTERLCALPSKLTTPEQRAFFEKMRRSCPELPASADALLPARKFVPKTSNIENGELYAVWPFRLVTVAQPALRQKGVVAYERRLNHLDVGWGYDGNVAALLGLTDEAARILLVKVHNSNPAYRWPATWGPNYDWLPDQNHGGNLLTTTDLMLLQADSIEQGGAIRLLPAWPKGWDVGFKLHAPGRTVVRCVAKGGRVVKLEVTPTSRRKDIVLPTGWTLAE